MSQLLRYLFLTAIPVLIAGAAWPLDEPAAQPSALPAGAVARLGESRFLNYGRLFSIAFSPDGKLVAGGAWDGTVRVWDVASGKDLHFFHEQNTPVRALAFTPDGSAFAYGGKTFEIVLRDTLTGKELHRLKGHGGTLTNIAFSPDGKLLASKAYDQTIRLWHVAGASEVRRLVSQDAAKQGNDAESPIAFSRDGKTVTSATTNLGQVNGVPRRTFRVWDVASGAEVRSFPDDSPWHGPVAFSPEKKLLAAASGPTQRIPARIRFWDLDTGRSLPHIDLPEGTRMTLLTFLTFSPDGKTIASSGSGPIQIWELATRREAVRFPTPDDGTSCLTFSPNGRLLASGSTDTTALLWDGTDRIQKGTLLTTKLTPQEVEARWEDLGGPDAIKARRALWTLAAAGNESVAFLQTHLRPTASPASDEAISRLVADLNSSEYAVRAKASAELVKLAELAEPALVKAQKSHPPLELRRRIDELLKLVVEFRTKPSGDRLRGWRAVEILEQINTPQSRQLLKTLAGGAQGALLTQEAQASLARLERAAGSTPESR